MGHLMDRAVGEVGDSGSGDPEMITNPAGGGCHQPADQL